MIKSLSEVYESLPTRYSVDWHVKLMRGMMEEPYIKEMTIYGWHNLVWLLKQLRDFNTYEYKLKSTPEDAIVYKELVERFKQLDIPEGLDCTNELKEWFKEIDYAPKERL